MSETDGPMYTCECVTIPGNWPSSKVFVPGQLYPYKQAGRAYLVFENEDDEGAWTFAAHDFGYCFNSRDTVE